MPMYLVSLSAHSESVRIQSSYSFIVITESVSYLSLIAHLRQALVRARKKAYTISAGKLNPAKLADFAEIGCFVLVACPENSHVGAKVPSILHIAFVLPVLSDQASVSSSRRSSCSLPRCALASTGSIFTSLYNASGN